MMNSLQDIIGSINNIIVALLIIHKNRLPIECSLADYSFTVRFIFFDLGVNGQREITQRETFYSDIFRG